MTARILRRHGSRLRVLGWLGLATPLGLSAQTPPLQVFSRAELLATGRPRLSEALEALLPEADLPRPSNAEGGEHVRPLTFRGMLADQVLLLIDGRRPAPSPFLHTAPIIGRGQTAPDWDAIPLAAIERVELLSPDGARYGSGAVAGAINIVLRTGGTDAGARAGVTTAGDGASLQLSGSYQLALGAAGSAQLSGELVHYGATNRALPDRRPQYFPGDPRNQDPADRVDQRFGDPRSDGAAAIVSLKRRVGRRIEAYGSAGLTVRRNQSGDRWRIAADDRTVRGLYPEGFLPLLEPRLTNGTLTAGARGRLWGWRWDAGVGYARNAIRWDVGHTANASLGPASPTRFDSGTLRADQLSLLAGAVTRVRPWGWVPELILELGGEHRSEGYQLKAGEPNSWRYGVVPIQDGPHTGNVAEPGAQGFPGFFPEDAVTARRRMLAGYAGVSAMVRRRLSLSAAGRVEHYDELGGHAVYHLGATLSPWRALSLRAAVGTGLRAPALAETRYTRSVIRIVGPAEGVVDLTVPALSPVGRALEVPPLRLERSHVLELGGGWSGPRFSVSGGYYRIRVSGRSILSGNFDDPGIRAFLAQQGFGGVGMVRFLMSALSLEARGVEIKGRAGFTVHDISLAVTGGFSHTTTSVGVIESLSGILANLSGVLFDRVERGRLEQGQPRDQLRLAATAARRQWSTTLRAHYAGAISGFGAAADGSLDQRYGSRLLIDASLTRSLPRHLMLTLGAINLLGSHPDRNRFGDAVTEGNSYYGMFPYSNLAPFGFTGRSVYFQISWNGSGG